MTTEEAMTIDERRKYLTTMHARYRQANHRKRSVLLTEIEAIIGLHRKSLTRWMAQSSLYRSPRRAQRCAVYGPDIRRVVWESLDCICAERLTPQLLTTDCGCPFAKRPSTGARSMGDGSVREGAGG